ncbi:RNA-binding protein 48 [Bicyclus anynana]|uniref:RNA-binding protein 48 n=1 Tax=Bicyclus anynana TaxID=110368 RepID=A0A6J1N5V1_BICAN|nr:RNA-binding protein 48 [Bicyclus anynana]
MQDQTSEKGILLPHHEQETLCTTRLPYRQGRKLTAVKVYSISKESNHLLIFGVPSLNLRQETKALFTKFGKLLQFNISTEHASEAFTETYHAQYERIQSARHAKRMLDTKNFFGGSLHVCYAPEFESIDETRQKLFQRQKDIIFRLRNLTKDQHNTVTESNTYKTDALISSNETTKPVEIVSEPSEPIKLNMGVPNTIYSGKQLNDSNRKRKINNKRKSKTLLDDNVKKSYNSFEHNVTNSNSDVMYNVPTSNNNINITTGNISITTGNISITTGNITLGNHSNIKVIDCTRIDNEVVTNINESLNYSNFGNEVIRKIPEKPVNKIQFHLNKKS